MQRSDITVDMVRDALDYDPMTGIFIWKNPKCDRLKIGDRAGSISTNGYIKIMLSNIQFLGHRLAWFYVYGAMPKHHIDHINKNTSDNRIENLRDVTRSQNLMNMMAHKDNFTGHKGITYSKSEKRKKRYKVRIMVRRKDIFVGRYVTLDEAKVAYFDAAKKYHGEYSGVL